MRRRTAITLIILTLLLAAVAYGIYRHSTATAVSSSVVSDNASDELKNSSTPQQENVPPPPPPPPTDGSVSEPPEPVRTLTGMTSEQLQVITQYLPDGSQIATYPVGEKYKRPAAIEADLDGDGITEVIAVHTEKAPTASEPMPQLFLSVLTHDGTKLKSRSSTILTGGGVLFNIDANGMLSPLDVLDVTGDGHPEILVASGMGASLGGILQVFSVEGSSLHRLGNVPGHYFYVRSKGEGRPSEISARWRDGKQIYYNWNGREFEQAASK